MSRAVPPSRRAPRFAAEPLEPRETPALFTVGAAQTFSDKLNNNGHVITGDFNGDGLTDAVLTNYGSTSAKEQPGDPGQLLTVLAGQGNGKFTFSKSLTVGSDQHVSYVAAGDVDRDGDQDLVAVSTGANEVGKLTVFTGDGKGNFTKGIQVNSGGSNSAWVGLGQLTADNNLDILVCSFGMGNESAGTVSGNNVTVFQGDGKGGFDLLDTVGGEIAYIPTAGAIADFDGDGDQDLITTVPGVPPDSTADQPNGTLRLLTNNGAGGFDLGSEFDSGGSLPIGVTAADLDGDGRPDLVVANAGNPDANGLYANFGSGSSVGVLLANGKGTFGDVTTLLDGTTTGGSKSVFAVAVADFDGDSKRDIAAVTYGHPLTGANSRIPVYLGDGGGGFKAATGSPFNTGSTDGQYLAVGTFDAGATPDLVTVGAANKVVTLLNQTAAGAATTTGLQTSAASTTYGAGFTLTATVAAAAGTPTGTVTFLNGGTTLGTATLAAVGGQQVAALPVGGTQLDAGNYTLTARYDGAAGFAGSTSGGVAQSVAAVAPAVDLTAPPTATAGDPVTFTAVVSSALGTPGGSVSFYEGGALIGGPVALSTVGGQQRAVYATTLTAGTHVITASYLGAGNFAAADSAGATVDVGPGAPPAATTTTLASSANPATVGQAVTFTVEVAAAAGTPVGAVSLYDEVTRVGGPRTLATVGGKRVATFTLAGLTLGTHTLTAQYGGAAAFGPSTSDPLTQYVAASPPAPPAATTTALTASPSAAVYGQSVTLTAVVAAAAGTPAGMVAFSAGGASLGADVPLVTAAGGRVATLTVPAGALPAGTHTVTARFLGTAEFAASEKAITLPVQAATPAVEVSGGGTSTVGRPVAWVVAVTSPAGTPGGTVSLFDGATQVAGPVVLAPVGGRPQATVTVTLPPGAHSITAQYAGGGNYGPATSGAVNHQVNKAGVTVALTATPAAVTAGQSVALSATVADAGGTGLAPTGTVTFRVGGRELAVVPVAGGAAATSTAAIPTGTQTVTAEYAGDGNFVGGAVSAQVTVTGVVVQPPVTPRPVLTGYREFAVGAGDGQPAVARFFNPDGSERFSRDLFPGFDGGVRVTSADFNGDGVADVVAGTGPGTRAQVRVLDGKTQANLFDEFPFDDFTSGLFVAAGDVTGDGVPDLIVTPDQDGGPRVCVYRGGDFRRVASFFGIIGDPGFRGGVRAGVGDVDGDGVADIVVSAGFGGGPRVAGFSGAKVAAGDVSEGAKLFRDFFAFDPGLRNGAYVTAGDLDGDGRAELVAGAGPGGGPRVLAFDAGDLLAGGGEGSRRRANFFAGNPDNRGGVRIAVRNLDGDTRADLVVGDGAGGGTRVTTYRGAAIETRDLSFDAFPGINTGVFVG